MATLGGLGWGGKDAGGEAGVFFQGCVCLCVGKGDWLRDWGRRQCGERGGSTERAGGIGRLSRPPLSSC